MAEEEVEMAVVVDEEATAEEDAVVADRVARVDSPPGVEARTAPLPIDQSWASTFQKNSTIGFGTRLAYWMVIV